MVNNKLRELKNLNEISVRTFKWLNVNNITLDNLIINETDYNYTYFDNLNITGVSLQKNTIELQKQWEKHTIYNDIPFNGVDYNLTNENTNNFNAGFQLIVDENTAVKENICINYSIDNKNKTLVDTNNIHVKENSSVNVYINFLGTDDTEGFHQGYINILVEKNSHVNVVFIQNLSSNTTNIQSINANVMENAKVSFVIAEVGSLNTVVNSNINLLGDTSEGYVKSIYVSNNSKKVDLNYLINHVGKKSISNSETKGVLLDRSKKVFKGGIKFYKGAKGANGVLGENVLLLSDTAKNSSIPLLLCDEDDVKGEHIASAGKIDENVLFYLMTRGLSEEDAKKLFVQSYFNPIIDLIHDDKLKSEIENVIYKKVNLSV